MLRSMKDLEGFTIGATNGEIGTVKECYFDDVNYAVRYVVVETGGWLAERKVPSRRSHSRGWTGSTGASRQRSHRPRWEDGHRYTQTGLSSARDRVHGYHDSRRYWEGSYLWGPTPYPYVGAGPVLSAADLEREREWTREAKSRDNPHLRSSAAVTGHHIQATDGDVGHVEDFLVDDQSWAIRYMIVDTSNWWAGAKVLVAPEWIGQVDWDESKVHVTVTRAQIKEPGVRSLPARRA